VESIPAAGHHHLHYSQLRGWRFRRGGNVDIVVKGRRSEVSERYRAHVREKLSRLARLDGKAFRIDVEVCHESNPRQAGACERLELTVYSRGPVIRAEASAGDVYAALDLAAAKLEERLRRAADRRHTRQHGHLHGQSPVKGADRAPDLLTSDLAEGASLSQESGEPAAAEAAIPGPSPTPAEEQPDAEDLGHVLVADGPLVVREKVHNAPPMTLDEALHHMELVGHDFFLYCDSATRLPSVVYRRRGYTYGVLRLETDYAESMQTDASQTHSSQTPPSQAQTSQTQAPHHDASANGRAHVVSVSPLTA
jgi:ribosomal subunit interface protein